MGRRGNALTGDEREALFETLSSRFAENPHRHPRLSWDRVRLRLDANPGRLVALTEMERTGGEPDVVAVDAKGGEVVFVDCAQESPAGRRSLCYDRAALDARKTAKPRSSAVEEAARIGIGLLTEAEYRRLQELGEFDRKTSSWIETPLDVRKLGGALFMDRRFGRVFTYHNGADSYYAARGFRGSLRV